MKNMLTAVLAITVLAVGVAGAATRNGDLDPNFGAAGQVRVDIGAGSGAWASMAIAPNEDILLAGSYDAGMPTGLDFVVARLHPDGSPDTGFSFDGKVELVIGPNDSSDSVFGLLVQADGKIVIIGDANSPDVDDGTDMTIVRLNADGTLDATFGGDGKVFIDFGLGGTAVAEHAADVASFADGKLVVVGSTPVTGESLDMALVKLNTDGTRDTGFGTGGRAVVRFSLNAGFKDDSAYAVAVDDLGRVIVAGTTQKTTEYDTDFAVARLLDNGQLDPSFNGDGRATVAFDLAGDLSDTLSGLLRESDGSLTLIGRVADTSQDMAVARLHPDGSPVDEFGNAGRVTVPFDLGETNLDAGFDAVRTIDGKLLVAGLVQGPTLDVYTGLAQLLPNGTLDAGFGIVGKALIINDFGGTQSATTGVRLVDGRAIVGGLADDNAQQIGLMSAAVVIDVLFANDFEPN